MRVDKLLPVKEISGSLRNVFKQDEQDEYRDLIETLARTGCGMEWCMSETGLAVTCMVGARAIYIFTNAYIR